jgi:hypothetical protein
MLCFPVGALAGARDHPASRGEPAAPSSGVELLPRSASRAIDLATRLAVQGPRPAASEGEARARELVASELASIGLQVTVEPFTYESFQVTGVDLDLGGVPVAPVVVGIDPFRGRLTFSGEAIVVTDLDQASAFIRGRVVVTNHPLIQLMISEHDPAAVICVAPGDLDAFVARGAREVSLQLHGAAMMLESANVVARSGTPKPGEPRFLVTSHLDAYRDSPGANDNGTGLGAMIELARSLAPAGDDAAAPVTFVAFGAEESGAVGSRAYLESHLDELADVVAVVNLDTLGGARGPVVGTVPNDPSGDPPGVRNRIPEPLRRRAWEGPEGLWRVLHPAIISTALTSRYPGWLQQVVAAAAEELGLEVTEVDLISDHRTFALAGIPAISIQSREHHIHSAEDTAAVLVPETVAASMELVAAIMDRLLLEAARDRRSLR